MRIIKRERGYFLGTHKGHEIEIERDRESPPSKFYIRVRCLKSGMHGYDGWAPEEVETMAQAKREAIRGAMLDTEARQRDGGRGRD